MRRLLALLLAAALGPGAALLVACGDRNDLIPSSNADAIKNKLDSVTDAAARGRCGRARTAASAAREEAGKLPDDVDSKLRSTLEAGLDRVASQADDRCTQSTATTNRTTATTRSIETLPPPTTDTLPPTTQTAPPTTTRQTTPPDPGPSNGTGGVSPPGGGSGNGRGKGGNRSPAD